MKSTAIILSAGSGKRMQADIAKQYLDLNGKPVLSYSLQAFAAAPEIDNIVLVAGESDLDFVKNEIVEKYQIPKVTDIVAGGAERYHSVFRGLNAPGARESDFVFIHDGARPFISGETIRAASAAVYRHPAIVVGMPVKDTVKRVDAQEMVCETLDRESLWAVQTPQVFAAELIREAYRLLINDEKNIIARGLNITDDALALELFSPVRTKLIRGTHQNIKITTPEDLAIAMAIIMAGKAAGCHYSRSIVN